MDRKEDRRIRYTKALLRDALVELLQENPITRVSVTMLCERADVHRSTFYAHYKDAYDLLAHVEQDVFEQVGRYLDGPGYDESQPVSLQKLQRILEYGKENADLLSVLLAEGNDISFQRDLLSYMDIASLMPGRVGDERRRDYVVLFGINGCLSVIRKWLQDGAREPTGELAALMLHMVYEGTQGL